MALCLHLSKGFVQLRLCCVIWTPKLYSREIILALTTYLYQFLRSFSWRWGRNGFWLFLILLKSDSFLRRFWNTLISIAIADHRGFFFTHIESYSFWDIFLASLHFVVCANLIQALAKILPIAWFLNNPSTVRIHSIFQCFTCLFTSNMLI